MVVGISVVGIKTGQAEPERSVLVDVLCTYIMRGIAHEALEGNAGATAAVRQDVIMVHFIAAIRMFVVDDWFTPHRFEVAGRTLHA